MLDNRFNESITAYPTKDKLSTNKKSTSLSLCRTYKNTIERIRIFGDTKIYPPQHFSIRNSVALMEDRISHSWLIDSPRVKGSFNAWVYQILGSQINVRRH